MIKHVVMWRIANNLDVPKPQLISRLVTLLNDLPPIIPQIKDFEVGVNVKEAPTAFDVTLISSFESWEALAEYQAHSTHQKVATFLKTAAIERAVVDFVS